MHFTGRIHPDEIFFDGVHSSTERPEGWIAIHHGEAPGDLGRNPEARTCLALVACDILKIRHLQKAEV